ncbi:hypothetical protein AB0J35_29765 [Nonomuraea angiospora]|uniref:hypothetical protein n=1 Tax=Nonomuraea angiospora TaxID=46172 RepID=UPI00343494CE
MSASLHRDLAARVDGEVRFDAGSRAAYAHDASNYRQVHPLVRRSPPAPGSGPRHLAELLAELL